MIVVDLGAAYCDASDSVDILAEQFKPDVIYGFDPRSPIQVWKRGETVVVLSNEAAWTYDGMIPFRLDGVASCLCPADEPLLDETMWLNPAPAEFVPCFDLARWLDALGEQVVLKSDIESAEIPLFEHLIAQGADQWISLTLMEWHCAEPEDRDRRAWIESNLSCPIIDWAH